MRRRGKVARRILQVALGLLLCSMPSALAAQLDAVDIASGTTQGPEYSIGGANTTGGGFFSCPTGTRVVTGGSYPVAVDEVDEYAVTSSAPTFDGKGWYSHAFEEGGTGSSVRVDVVFTCVPAAKVKGTKVRSKTGRLLETRTVTTKCPRGTSAYTGGAFLNEPGPDSGPGPVLAADAQLSASAPLKNARGWTASVLNRTPRPLDLTVTARCLANKKLSALKAVTETMPPDQFNNVRDSLTCPANTRLTAAGALWHRPGKAPNAGSIANSLLEGVAAIDRQLDYRGETQAGSPLVLTARGFCLR